VIRRATEDDLTAIMDMAQALHAESDVSMWGFDPNVAFAYVRRFVLDPVKILLVDDAYKGCLLGHITSYAFGPTRLAIEDYWYVKPEHRGSIVGFRLLDKFLAWAKINGADEAMIGIGTGINVANSSRMMERAGFRPVGGMFKKVLSDVR
jgi:GNAT superfamily N-acetyltransferase